MSQFENILSESAHDINPDDRAKSVEKYLEILKNHLKGEAEILREDGWLIDDECRIDIDKFLNMLSQYTADFIEQRKNNTAKLEDKFQKRLEVDPKKKEFKEIGELLEVVKTLLVNQDLYGGRLEIVRTATVDDINNGIDEIAYDKKTGFPIGVIDVTSNIDNKIEYLDRRMKIGGKLDFGFKIIKDASTTKVSPSPLSELPLFIFEMKLEEILNIAQIKVYNKYEGAQKIIEAIEKRTLDNFIRDGMKILRQKDLSEIMRAQYIHAVKIFIEISQSKGYRK